MLDRARIARWARNSQRRMRLAEPALARGLTRRSGPRVALYYETNLVSFSQAYPFFHFAAEFGRRFDADIRARRVASLVASDAAIIDGADICIVQTWFRMASDVRRRLFERLRARTPNAVFAFMDPSATSDLRFAADLDPYVDYYLKKSTLKDASIYFQPTRGETYLSDRYAPRYGLDLPTADWNVPVGFMAKVRLTPTFQTSASLVPGFERPRPTPVTRTIDIHARLSARGTGVYQHTREEALRVLGGIEDRHVVTGVGVTREAFMDELYRSKIAYSPFGYGELCWRDQEAALTGALLVKQDMSHLRTDPEVYLPNETYVPHNWDFSDLAGALQDWLNRPDERQAIADRAFDLSAEYIRESRFVDQMSFLFAKT